MTLPYDWRAGGAFLDHDGHRIFYRVGGEGPCLLCVHGFPTSSWDWHRVWPGLTDRFRVVALDLLGYGFSDKPAGHSYATSHQADLVEALLLHLDVTGCHVLAHDYGDTVVQELLARAAEGRSGVRLESVTFLNGGLFYEAIRPRWIQRVLLSPMGPLVTRLYDRRAFGRSIRPLFGPETRPSEAEVDALWALVTHGDGDRIVHRLIRYLPERRAHRDRWVDALVRSQSPLRFVVGCEDPVSGRHMAERYRQLVPEPDVVLLEGVGHFPQLEAPGRVEEAVLEVVGRGETPGDG